MSASRVRFNFNQKSLVDILEEMNTGRLVIPDHQRGFVWDFERQQKLIETVLEGMPMPAVIVYTERGGVSNLEDGQQRLTTLNHFYNGFGKITTIGGKSYKDLTERERAGFESYQVGIIEYKSATKKQVIQIFNNFQNGMGLSVGERLDGLRRISPFVQYAVKTLLTPGEGLHTEFTEIWGYRTVDNAPRSANLTQIAALVAGLAVSPKYFSRKWEDLKEITEMEEFPEEIVTSKLKRLLKIFRASEGFRNKTALNWNWNFGNTVGYVAYSLSMENVNEYNKKTKKPIKDWTHEAPADLDSKWITYLVALRNNPDMLKDTLHKDLNSARSWTTQRWKNGYNRVFNPTWEEFDTIVEEEDSYDE